MKNLKLYLLIVVMVAAMLTIYSCSEGFLDYAPKVVVASEDLSTAENVEKMVIAAYASLGNDHFWAPYGNFPNSICPPFDSHGDCGYLVVVASSIKHQAPSTKHQIPSSKSQVPNSKFQGLFMIGVWNFGSSESL